MLTFLQHVAAAGWRRAAHRFARALLDPAAVQAGILRRLLAQNAASAYGRAHRLADLRTPADLRRHLPVVTHEALAPWLERAAAGEPGVLTAEPVLAFERTSGSTAANKLIPYTRTLLAEFQQATDAWLFDLWQRRLLAPGTVSYWSISPALRRTERTPGNVRIGLDDDTAYFDPFSRWVLRRMLAVPPEVTHLTDLETWRFTTCRHLLAAEHLGMISVWSPTFLLLLVDFITAHREALLAALPPRRGETLARSWPKDGALDTATIWPELRLLSCWADGPSAHYLSPLTRAFRGPRLQPKGLLATEGVVSFPWGEEEGSLLAVTSHFLEFIDLSRPNATPLLAHELEVGADYSPVLTTGGGLWRYHLQDVIRCVGRLGQTPRIRFVGKLDATTDLCGEKLSAVVVEAALNRAATAIGLAPRFLLLAPRPSPPGYILFVDADADDALVGRLAAAAEQALAEGHHYRYCRALGQLDAVTPVRIRRGWQTLQQAREALGAKPGEIKPTALATSPAWTEALLAAAVSGGDR